MKKFFDPFRKKWLFLTPEEKVRQSVVQAMLALGYPKSQIALEVGLESLAHLQGKNNVAVRRIDIISFAKNIHPKYPLYPLLLVECKVDKTNHAASFKQLLGYQAVIKPFFFALADEESMQTFWYDQKNLKSVDGLLAYSQILHLLKALCI